MPETETRNEAIIATMNMIIDDCKTDAEALDGKPFTGRVVAEQFGATLAMLSAVAKAVRMLAEDSL